MLKTEWMRDEEQPGGTVLRIVFLVTRARLDEKDENSYVAAVPHSLRDKKPLTGRMSRLGNVEVFTEVKLEIQDTDKAVVHNFTRRLQSTDPVEALTGSMGVVWTQDTTKHLLDTLMDSNPLQEWKAKELSSIYLSGPSLTVVGGQLVNVKSLIDLQQKIEINYWMVDRTVQGNQA